MKRFLFYTILVKIANIAELLYRNHKWVNTFSFLRFFSPFCRINSVCQGGVSYASQLSRVTRERSRALTALRSFKNCDLPISTDLQICCFRYFNRRVTDGLKLTFKNFCLDFFMSSDKTRALCKWCFHHWSLCDYASCNACRSCRGLM